MKPSELLSSPEKWTQGAYARDKEGDVTSSDSLYAVCWCLNGAIDRCFLVGKIEAFYKLQDVIKGSIVEFNDAPGRTFEEIHNALIQAGL